MFEVQETILTNLIIVKKKGGDDFIKDEDADNYIASDLLGWLEDCNGQNKNKAITMWRETAIDKDTYLIACNGSPEIDNYDVIKNGYKYDELQILDVRGVYIPAYPWYCDQSDTLDNIVRIYNKITRDGHHDIKVLCNYNDIVNNNGQDEMDWLFNQ